MEKISTVEDLKMAIQHLEAKKTLEGLIIREQLNSILEDLKPLNILKNTFRSITASPDFSGNLIGGTMSLAAGFLSKGLIVGGSFNPIRRVLGSLLQFGVSKLVSHNQDFIQSLPVRLLEIYNKKK